MNSVWSTIPGQENTFIRPLGTLETSFAWDSISRGVADFVSHFVVETDGLHSSFLFSKQNVESAWRGLKCVFPLIGATLSRREDGSGFDFIVSEKRNNTVQGDEIVHMVAQSDDEVVQMVDRSFDLDPSLSDDLLAQLWVISVPGTSSEQSSFVARHVLLYFRHAIGDGTATTMLSRVFMGILIAGKIPRKYQPQGTFLEYLNLHPAVEDLNPARKCIPRLRWKRAIAAVIAAKRSERTTGGHSFPKNDNVHTPETPLRCATLHESFTEDITSRIISNCHQANFSLGAALFVISQIAHARLYHRLYAQGFMSQSEWDRRKVEPMHFLGPMNIRPYLDKEWLAGGGHSRGCIAISFFPVTLPHMPIAKDSLWNKHTNPAPPFHALLSKKRFLFRCKLAKEQARKTLNHPLTLEFTEVSRKEAVQKSKAIAMRWLVPKGSHKQPGITVPQAAPLHTISNNCSTLGHISSYGAYIRQTKDEDIPRVPIRTCLRRVLSRSRPQNFYVFAETYDNKLQLHLAVDVTTYDEELVREWFCYYREAMEWYLGKVGTELEVETRL